MNFYAFHIGDYASATAHLSITEDGVYRRLLDVYYVREAPIPLDLRQAYRLVRAQTEIEREAVETILREFFTETAEGWRHARCEAEIEKASEKRGKAKASANARWRAAKGDCSKKQHDCKSDANAYANAQTEECERIEKPCEGNAPNPNPNPIKENPTPTPPVRSGRGQSDAGFERFWLAYPRRRNRGQAEKAWAKLKPDGSLLGRILQAVEVAKSRDDWRKDGGRFVPYPATWLNAKGWEDEDAPAATGDPAGWWLSRGYGSERSAIEAGEVAA